MQGPQLYMNMKTTTARILKEKKAVIFDFDGTIADTFHLHEQAFNETLADYPVQFRYHDFAGMSTKEAMARLFLHNQIELDETEKLRLVKEKQQRANRLYKESIGFIPGAKAFIEALASQRYKLYVASSGSRMNVTAGLQALGIYELFLDVITADDVTKAKPDPEIFQSVLLRNKLEAEAAVVIEDAVSGIRSAAAAGIDVICIDGSVSINEALPVRFLQTSYAALQEVV